MVLRANFDGFPMTNVGNDQVRHPRKLLAGIHLPIRHPHMLLVEIHPSLFRWIPDNERRE